ncbi:hypothetical protein CLU79DRAFT_776637 [Phycomyces nitens]|nr:hypothetical protein CLU79DRAFT_776637 [Phycomyces nitens]
MLGEFIQVTVWSTLISISSSALDPFFLLYPSRSSIKTMSRKSPKHPTPPPDPAEPEWPLGHDIFSQKSPGCGLNLTYLASRSSSIANNYRFNANGSRSYSNPASEPYTNKQGVSDGRPSLECFDPHYSFRKHSKPILSDHTKAINNDALRDQQFKLPNTLTSNEPTNQAPFTSHTEQNEERFKYLSTLYSAGYSDLQDSKKDCRGLDTKKNWFGLKQKDKPSAGLRDIEKADDLLPQRLSRAYFIIGIFFPPFWIVGSIYNPASDSQPATSEQRTDTKWRRRSRICLFCFIILAILLVLGLTLHPTVIGWKELDKVDVKRTIGTSGPLYNSIITPV